VGEQPLRMATKFCSTAPIRKGGALSFSRSGVEQRIPA
jgi:hypothetical protein